MAGSGDELEDAGLSYIFLDVISCGLGGAILLGVILSVPHERKPVAVAADPYLDVRVEVTDATGNPDTEALPNIWLKPPGRAEGFDLPLERFELSTGRVRRGEEVDPNLAGAGVSGTQVFLTGFFRHDEGRAEQTDARFASGLRLGLYELLITEPPAGTWEFRVKYQNRRNFASYLATTAPPIRVRLSAQAGGTEAANPDNEVINFSDISAPVSVTVAGGKVKNVKSD